MNAKPGNDALRFLNVAEEFERDGDRYGALVALGQARALATLQIAVELREISEQLAALVERGNT